MKLALRFCLGLFASLALTLLVVSGVRAQDTATSEGTTNNPAVTTTEAETTTQSPATTAEQSPEVKAQKAAECGSMGMKGGHHRWMEGREGRQGGEPGMIGMSMMGDHMAMMRMISRNPKMAGRMLEMRADMMRAIADVMTKYGKEMESGDWQAFQSSTSTSPSSED
jgi:hypothetical protein